MGRLIRAAVGDDSDSQEPAFDHWSMTYGHDDEIRVRNSGPDALAGPEPGPSRDEVGYGPCKPMLGLGEELRQGVPE
jgi:hypothetical protein